jgi:outer membrane protein OmpA-like peptidoglycan-associated protein
MKRFVGCLALAGAMSLQAGCSTINPYTGVSVTRDGDNIILNMPGNLTFDTDSTTVKSSFRPVLDAVSEVLKEYKSTMIQVAGHTDSTGGDKYNLMLSQQRAQSVANILGGFGVEQVRMDTVGFGETQPIASNGTASGREQNRRVELTLLPYTE